MNVVQLHPDKIIAVTNILAKRRKIAQPVQGSFVENLAGKLASQAAQRSGASWR